MAAITLLGLFLSALGIFSLVSVSVSRRIREIGVRVALGANTRQVLIGILARAAVVMASGIGAGGAILLWFNGVSAARPGGSAMDVVHAAGYFGLTSLIMLTACLLACLAPARRALRITPTDALREV